jgi:predicted NAD/FAD-binding protein
MKTRSREAAGPRIGIVGGGASGLAAAHALRELGYRRITVFEREPDVGGKCYTIVHDGRSYELGAALLTGAYRRVHALMREVHVRSQSHLADVHAALRDGRAWRQSHGLGPAWVAEARASIRFVLDIMLLREGLHLPGFTNLNADLALPFDDWCRARHCEEVRAFLEPWVTGFGYGSLSEVPAAYVLKYAAVFQPPFSEIPDDGYGGLFRKVAATLAPVDVQRGAHVTRVVRRQEAVLVQTTRGNVEVDGLILACPLDEALGFLDATRAEVDLFERIRHREYFVVGANVSGDSFRHRYTFFRENFGPASLGQPTFAYRRWPDTNTVIFYGYTGDDDWDAKARRSVAATVARGGGHVDDVIAIRKWRYFPHVQTDDIAGGYYQRLEGLQGLRRTYYCGELFAFAAVEHVVSYARALVHAHFPRVGPRLRVLASPGGATSL